jgi:hypothetical protein
VSSCADEFVALTPARGHARILFHRNIFWTFQLFRLMISKGLIVPSYGPARLASGASPNEARDEDLAKKADGRGSPEGGAEIFLAVSR